MPKNHLDSVHGRGLDLAMKMSLDPEAALTEVSDDMEVKTIQQICRMPSYLGQFAFTTATSVDTYQLIIPVDPNRFNYVGTTCYPYWSVVSRRFAFWRGGMKFLLKFITNRFATARIRIAHVPGSKLVNTYVPNDGSQDYGDCPHAIIDIKGDTEYVLSVPYMSDRPMYPTNKFNNVAFNPSIGLQDDYTAPYDIPAP